MRRVATGMPGRKEVRGGIAHYARHHLLMMITQAQQKITHVRIEMLHHARILLIPGKSKNPTIASLSFSQLRESSPCVSQSWQKSQQVAQPSARSRPHHGRRALYPPLFDSNACDLPAAARARPPFLG